ncbi:phosphoribosylanthranilate isomerase [Lysobacter ruishenii]|uniref:N-(5'-phosphoribosyl)anthranilate isomerase n=1 Tax=Aerolutibacter ruishenii TaxID=686800 RepID=A0A562LY79_9GAMM|nr:phosphoribosylanthranilate isomerase [Lysobacter ruishenii]
MIAQRRTRVKFCGMTRADDIREAALLGVDAVGLVFAERSRRRLTIEQAAALRDATPPLVDVVALFMDNSAEQVREVIARVRPSLLQFHGSEPPAFCEQFGLPYLKAVGMGGQGVAEVAAVIEAHRHAAGFLLDSHAPGAAGGTGERFDWADVPIIEGRPLLLAGGLAPDNVATAIRMTHVWGVDVSSGIESAPGQKDAGLMLRFIEAVLAADADQGRRPDDSATVPDRVR